MVDYFKEDRYILKRKRNATLSKMVVPSFSSKNSARDNKLAKYCYFLFALHTAPKSDRCDLWLVSCNEKSKATPIFKVTKLKNCDYFAKKAF